MGEFLKFSINMYAAAISLNAIDIFMAVVIAAVIYISRKDGIIAGLFKLFGLWFVIFITFHYYAQFADFLRSKIFNKDTPVELLAFSLLAIPTAAIFIIICQGWVLILRLKAFAVIDRWGGLMLALVRSYFLCGLIFVAVILFRHDYTASRVRHSASWTMFRNAAIGVYEKTYVKLIQKFFPGEAINEEVFKLVADDQKKSGKKRP